jgi:transketolase
VPDEVREVFANRKAENIEEYEHWQELFSQWQSAHPEKAKIWNQHWEPPYGEDQLLEELIPAVADKVDATRSLSGLVIQQAAKLLPGLVGGSADLEPSTKTLIKNAQSIVPASLDSQVLPDPSFSGRNIHFGIREHAMGSIVNGILLFGGFQVFGSTFLVFSDYMRPSLAA